MPVAFSDLRINVLPYNRCKLKAILLMSGVFWTTSDYTSFNETPLPTWQFEQASQENQILIVTKK